MGRRLSSAAALVFAAAFAGPAVAADRVPLTAPKPAPRVLADPALAAAVRAELRLPAGERMTRESLRDLYFLRAKDAGIASLAGLDGAVNLALVDLAGNEIGDLSPLRGLGSLQSLDLTGNAVADLAPLAEVPGLQYAKLDGNRVTDLSPLAKLDRLSALYLAKNAVTDLSPLSGLKKLTSLDVSDNDLTDAGPLAGLPYLSSVTLSGNRLTDITPLASLPDVRFLILERNGIEDLSPLAKAATEDASGPRRFAPYLRLYLEGNPLSGAAKADQLPALREAGVTVDLGGDATAGDGEGGGGE